MGELRTDTGDALIPVPVPPRVRGASKEMMNGIVEPIAVYFEDLDSMGMLHNSRYINLFERAHINYWARAGWTYDPASPRFKEMLFVIKENSVTYHEPIMRAGTVNVRMWIDKLGNTSVIYGFQVLSEDQTVLHAEGRRVIIRIDPETGRPASIPQDQRDASEPLLRAGDASDS